MAQQTKITNETEAAAERIRDLNEQVLDFGRKAGLSFLESYEATLRTFADYQDKVADSTQVGWIATIAKAQASLTREVSHAYTSTARELLK
jgi:hypothetical protein